MGKVSQFSIYLDKADGVYMSGELMTGQIYIQITERLKFNYIRMLAKGVGKVHWLEERGTGESSYTVSYSACKEYIHFNQIFAEKPKDGNDVYLEQGDWNYPFQVQLPFTLPTSYEHEFGSIRYTLEGHIDIPWAFDKRVILSISVVNPLDLNLSPALRQPASISVDKIIGCCFCKSEPITATLSIPKTGFVNGEGIIFSAQVQNLSNTDLKEISFQLVQNTLLNATAKSRLCSKTIAEIHFFKQIKGQSYEEWNNGILVIPPVCPSTNKASHVIEISYSVNLHVNPSGPSLSFNAFIPITIGTIPLAQRY